MAEFLQTTGLSMRSWNAAPERNIVEQRVRETADKWDFGHISLDRRDRNIATAISLATTTFGHTRSDVQVHIALFAILGLCIDDLEIKPSALDEFVPRLQAGSPQQHPVLDNLADNLQALPNYFPPFAASAIFAATLQFVNSTLFDRRCESMTLTEGSMPYVRYKRSRNGLSEAFSFFAWDRFDFPDVSSYIQVISSVRHQHISICELTLRLAETP